MRVSVLPASELTAGQLAAMNARVDAPEHIHDRGACLFWHQPAAFPKFFVGVLSESGVPIGIAYVDGPLNHAHPAWWLDSRFRGKRLGAEMIDSLVAVLRANGYSGAGRITIDTFRGEYHEASSSLAKRFTEHFSQAAIR